MKRENNMDYEKIDERLKAFEESTTQIESIQESQFEIAPDEIKASGEPSKTATEFLESKFGSEKEKDYKRIMALSAVAAGMEASPEEIASAVDEAAARTKTAYKVETGELDITQVAEVVIDHAAARLNAFIQSKLNMERIAETVSNVVAYVFPPARVAKTFIKATVMKVEPVVRKCITAGINLVANCAKKAVRGIKKAFSRVKRWINA